MRIQPVDTTTILEPKPQAESPPVTPHGSEPVLPKHLPTGPGPARIPSPSHLPHRDIVT